MRARQTTERAVVVVDVVGYGRMSSLLESLSGAEAIFSLNERIQQVIGESIKAINESPEAIPILATGDGAILVFYNAQEAHGFAVSVQSRARERNRSSPENAELHFRIGVSSGQMVIESPTRSGSMNFAGTAIIEATRLAVACNPGEIVISESAWSKLLKRTQRLYGSRGPVPGKIHERISARCYRFLPPVHEARG